MFAVKVSPFDGSTAGRRSAVEYGLAEGGEYKPLLVRGANQ